MKFKINNNSIQKYKCKVIFFIVSYILNFIIFSWFYYFSCLNIIISLRVNYFFLTLLLRIHYLGAIYLNKIYFHGLSFIWVKVERGTRMGPGKVKKAQSWKKRLSSKFLTQKLVYSKFLCLTIQCFRLFVLDLVIERHSL